MTNRFLATVLLLLGCISFSFAQKDFPLKPTTPEHLLMQQYEEDSTANALVLFEKGNAEIKKDGAGFVNIFFEHEVKIKIFNSNGLDKAEVEIPLYRSEKGGSKEKIESVTAMVTNPDRTVSRLDKREVYYEDVSSTLTLAKFAIPNVAPGAVIDYRYVVKSPFFYTFQPWYFQDDIPKLHSEYHTNIPANYKYNITLFGTLKLDKKEADIERDCFELRGLGSADCVVSDYYMTNIPAFIEEDFMTAKVNYLSALKFELNTFEPFQGSKQYYAKTWEDVDKEFEKETFDKELDRERYFVKNLPTKLFVGRNDLEHAERIYKFIQNKMFWNGEDKLFKKSDIRSAFEENKGSSTALNLILYNSLKAAGFKTSPMLVSKRQRGIPTKSIPGATQFNALIVKLDIGERSYLLDVTDKGHKFGMIRFELLNQYGRVLDLENGAYWHPLLPPESYSQRIFQAQINLEDNEARVREVSSGYYGLRARSNYNTKGEEAYFDEIANNLEARGDFELIAYDNQGLTDFSKPFTESYTIDLNRSSEKEQLIINPFLIESFSVNPFKLEKRTYPVDFAHPFSIKFAIIINTGSDYKLASKPENKDLQLPGGSAKLRYMVTEADNNIKIDLIMDVVNPLIAPEHYEALKEFFNEFVRLQNKNPITLIKDPKLTSDNAGK